MLSTMLRYKRGEQAIQDGENPSYVIFSLACGTVFRCTNSNKQPIEEPIIFTKKGFKRL
uniref:Uncharacterized protein n=1 Tax=Rhizophora mucronata TaxID=61149 RepID=A0A2P2MS69_RHIMU